MKLVLLDFVGTIAKEIKEYERDTIEYALEKKFGYYNIDDDYYSWAQKKFRKDRQELEEIVENILIEIYEVPYSDFKSDFPNCQFYLTGNHLSALEKMLRFKSLSNKFDEIYISGSINIEKPSPEFFSYAIPEGTTPEDVLVVDDDVSVILAAKALGYKTIQIKSVNDVKESLFSCLVEV